MIGDFFVDIEKIKKGDPDTFRRFFLYFYPKLKAYACRFVDEQTAEDLVQEVFASYWEKKKTIQVDSIYSFLYKWTQNKCLNYIKHQNVIDGYEAYVRIAEARVKYLSNTTDNDVFKYVSSRNLREIVDDSIKKLPPKCALSFRLCYYQDMSHKDVAREMEISVRTVEAYIRQATLLLREYLREIIFLLFMFYSIF